MDFNYYFDRFDLINNDTINYAQKLFIAIFIFILFYIVAVYSEKYFIDANNKSNNKKILHAQIGWIIFYIIVFFGFIFSLTYLDINIAPLFAILATFGLGIGLALQDSIKNIISGVYLSIYNIFTIGDDIEVKTLSSELSTKGKIHNFNLFYTTLENSKNNQIIHVPNFLLQTNLISIKNNKI